MADVKVAWGSKTDFTITVASLGNNAARESTVIDNGTDKYIDAHVAGFIKAGSSGVDSDGFVAIYAYASLDAGTTYSDAATGSDSAHTLNNNARLIGVVELNANSETAEFGPFPVGIVFGGYLPEDWGIIIENQSGATLDSTGGNHEIHYRGLYATVS